MVHGIKSLIILSLIGLSSSLHSKEFRWEQPLEFENGDPMTIEEIMEYRLYCDGVADPRTVFEGGPTNSGVVNFVPGSSHSCFMTSVHETGDESAPSNTVEFIESARPKAPILQ